MSALVPQTVQVLLGERNKKVSDKLATPGTLTRAENVEMTTTGRYQHRPGSFSDGQPSSSPLVKEIAAMGDELLAYGDTQLYSRIAGTWTQRGTNSLRHLTVDAEAVSTASHQNNHMFVRAGGFDWHVWTDVTRATDSSNLIGIRYSVRNTASGAYVVTDGVIDAAGSFPSIYVVGSNLAVVFMVVNTAYTTSTIQMRKIALATPTVVGAASSIDTTTAAAGFSSFFYDAFVKDSNILTLAYGVNSAGDKLRVREWNVTTMASSAVVTSAAAVENGPIGFLEHNLSDSTYYVSVLATTAAPRNWYQCRIPTSLASVTVTTLVAGFAASDVFNGYTTGYVDPGTGTQHMFGELTSDYTAAGVPITMRGTTYVTRTSGGVITNVGSNGHIGLASRPWVMSAGDRYMLIKWRSLHQPTYFAVDPTTFREAPYARAFSAVASAPATMQGFDGPEGHGPLPTPQVSGDSASIAVAKLGPGSTAMNPRREAWRLDLSRIVGGVSRPLPTGGALVLPGGFPLMYDGSSITELGFHVGPEKPVLTQIVGGGLLPAGTYRVCVAYLWTDAKGRSYRSPLSPEASITIALNDRITISTTGLHLTAKRALLSGFGGGPVILQYFISAANAGTAGQMLHRPNLDTVSNTAGTTQSLTYSQDLAANFGLIGEQEYSLNGVVIESAPTPNMRHMWNWGGRAWGLLEENRRAFAWSRYIDDDTLGIEFTDDFLGLVDDEMGDLTAGAGLGDRNLLFKRDAVYWMSGEGPDNTGSGSFSEPARIDGAPGTDNPRSIVSTDIGVFYQAPDKVVWLIGLGLERTPLGDPCVDITDTITSACLVPDKREVRFTTSAGTTLKYDLTHRRWMTNTIQPALSSCLFNNQWHYLTTGGFVRHEDSTLFTEAGTGYAVNLELAWLSPGGLAAYQRIWEIVVIGTSLDAAAYTLSAILDHDLTSGGTQVTRSIAASAIDFTKHGIRANIRVPLSMQLNTALKLRLSFTPTTGHGAGFEALLLQCGFDPGRLPKLPNSYRMT